MKPEAQRIAIAEVRGWRKFPYVVINGRRYDKETWIAPEFAANFNPDKVHAGCAAGLNTMPNYPLDLNAMREAVVWLFSSKPGHYERAYAFELIRVVCGFDPYVVGWDGDARVCAKLATATAAQHAEAFLRTLGIRDDSTKPAEEKE